VQTGAELVIGHLTGLSCWPDFLQECKVEKITEGPKPFRKSYALSNSEAALRILHLEDNPTDAEFLQVMLERQGINCAIKRVETREAFQGST